MDRQAGTFERAAVCRFSNREKTATAERRRSECNASDSDTPCGYCVVIQRFSGGAGSVLYSLGGSNTREDLGKGKMRSHADAAIGRRHE